MAASPAPLQLAAAASAAAAPAAARPAAGATGAAGGMFARNRAAAAAAPATPATAFRLSVAQRIAARRLQESKQTIPHFYLQTSVNARPWWPAARPAEPVKLAWDAFFVLAVARAIGTVRAVSLPVRRRAVGAGRNRCDRRGRRSGGRVVRDSHRFAGCARRWSRFPRRSARASSELRERRSRGAADPPGPDDRHQPRRLQRRELHADHQSAGSRDPGRRPGHADARGPHDDGAIGVEPRCTLTLSVDHRVASGKYAGDFLGAIVEEIEHQPEATT